ncbi:MAG: TVP38/TMEM64 family protein [Gemmatimonadales bacterium]|nr:MAG: TVP38/TMEM64 family protein [Gemmatimonadales bacterium]
MGPEPEGEMTDGEEPRPRPAGAEGEIGTGWRSRSGPVMLALLPTVVVVGGVGALVGFNPSLRNEFLLAWGLLWDGDPDAIRAWMLGFGGWAPVVSAGLQVATSVFPPGPSFLLGIVNAMIFGPLLGGLLTFGSAILAAALCFGIARSIGRIGVERIVSEASLARVDAFMARRGMLAVFLGRIVPFINPDLVSYAAGVTGIRWAPFLVAMAAGSVPSTVFYTLVGTWAVDLAGWVLLVVGLASVLPLLGLILYRRRYYRKRR